MTKKLARRLERLEAVAQETAEEVRQTCVPGPLAAALRELWASDKELFYRLLDALFEGEDELPAAVKHDTRGRTM